MPGVQANPGIEGRRVDRYYSGPDTGARRDRCEVVRMEAADSPAGEIAATIRTATPYSDAQLAQLKIEYDRCWPWLNEALAHGGNLHDYESLWCMLVEARAHLWPQPDAVGVTAFEHYPRGVVCKVWLAAGRLETIISAEPAIAAWAKSQGATHYQIDGRPGWARVMAKYGWARTATTIMRRL